jgi:hypothetical protein
MDYIEKTIPLQKKYYGKIIELSPKRNNVK